MTTMPHPYLRHPELRERPADKEKDIKDLYDWIKVQPRFPAFTENHAHLFLHACLWNMEAAKKALYKYSHIRGNSPDIFDNRDPLLPGMQFVYNVTHMAPLPKLSAEGYRILCYRLSDTDPSKMHFGEAVKAFCMFNDVQISEDGPIEGYIVVFDMKGVRLAHLAKVQFGPLRTFMAYIQEAHPVRLKKIYVVHAASFINQVMALVKPLIKTELMSLLHFTTSGPSEVISPECLPKDYGGQLDQNVEYYHNMQRKKIESEYREWLIDSNALREMPKEKKGDGKSSPTASNASMKSTPITPPTTSFRSLEID